MRSSDSKKQYERFLLDQFIKGAKLRAEVVEEREAPDFTLRIEGRLIGVEITQHFISHDTNRGVLQAAESVFARIVSRAQEIYQASGAPPAHVGVCFRSSHPSRKAETDRIADALASFVRSLNLTQGESVDCRSGEHDTPLPDGMSSVHALGIPSFDMAHWDYKGAGWVATLNEEAMQSRVDEKAKRLPNYQAAVAENWLVIVADATKPSQMFRPTPDFDPHRISSPFARTFFYRYPEGPVIELGGNRQMEDHAEHIGTVAETANEALSKRTSLEEIE